MATDTKKTNSNDLIAKIKSLQETIDKQSTASLIDIDIQLDYIRTLYESCIVLREDILAQKEKNKKKTSLSECGTLPLFEDMEEENSIVEEEAREDVNLSLVEEESPQVEEELFVEEETQELLEEIEEVDNVFPVELEETEIDESEIKIEFKEDKIQLLEELASEIEEDNQDEYDEESDDIADVEDDVNDEIDDEIDDEIEDIDEIVEEEETVEIEETVEKEIVSIPDMDIELDITLDAIPFEPISSSIEEIEPMEEKSHPKTEIDIDSIEFAEDDYDDSDEEDTKTTPPSQSSHIGIPTGRPVYWGDEVDIEDIAAKPTSIGDTFRSEKPSLNEIVSGFKPDASIGMKLQNESVTDLMKSIDMNNKFLFVKELFKGNGSAFTEEINNLNNHSKLEGAFRYLDKIKEKYNWDEKSEAYRQLYHLILRKYAK